jgi:hypothetical protein
MEEMEKRGRERGGNTDIRAEEEREREEERDIKLINQRGECERDRR